MVAASGLVGEVLASVASMRLLEKRHGIPVQVYTRPTLFLISSITISVLLNRWLIGVDSPWLLLLAVLILWTTGVVASAFLFPQLMSLSRNVLTEFLSPKRIDP
jgi:hypothetical protein